MEVQKVLELQKLHSAVKQPAQPVADFFPLNLAVVELHSVSKQLTEFLHWNQHSVLVKTFESRALLEREVVLTKAAARLIRESQELYC